MKQASILRFDTRLSRTLTALGLVGACTVVDKGDYTFTDEPEEAGGESGSSSGGSSGSSSGTGGAGRGGTSGEAGESSGGDGNGGTSGTSGEAGGGMGGDGGGVCEPNPCENGGACTPSGPTFSCECAAGYEGDTCADEIDECDPNPCVMNGRCTDLVADFSCECPREVTGKTCNLPRFQGIPGPPGFANQATLARAVSADGTVVLGELSGPVGGVTVARPFRWSVDGGSTIVPLPSVIRADVTVHPWSISGDGEFWVGHFQSASTNGPPSPIGGPTVLSDENQPPPTFTLPASASAGFAFDTNQDGTRSVGNFYDSMGSVTRAVRYNETGMSMPLPNPYGQTSPLASANGVTRDGAIAAGTAKDTAGSVFIVFWTEAGTTAPGQVRTMMGISDLEVHGVSSDAAITAGTYWDPTFSNFAFYTSGTRFVPLVPTSGAAPPRSNAWDVSDDGNFIVGDIQLLPGMMPLDEDVLEQTTMTPQQAIVWKPDGSPPRTVLDLLRDAGVTPAGWTLRTAYGVSADGKVVVGAGVDPMGLPQGFIARLP
ncbi:MAG TPA: hypothetical protein VFZ53_02065 [Polyangiaceae bacterium]